jgi:RIO kinase 1
MTAPRHARRQFDDEQWEPAATRSEPEREREPEPDAEAEAEPLWSTYVDATRGPEPVPDWVVTDPRAVDLDRGVMKTGKEADVSLIERSVPGEPSSAVALMAVKRYRSAEHRMFHRDAGYLEGRRVRRSREMRAMETRTAFGRELIAGQWAAAEFAVLSRLWEVGAAVPYPVQLLGTELMMEFIGSPEGVAAPRLAQVRPDRVTAEDLYSQLRRVLRQLVAAGYAHGDLSAYNVLVDEGRLVLIDLPQAVDLVGNPQGFQFLQRDCLNICRWFAGHGVSADPTDLVEMLLMSMPGNA